MKYEQKKANVKLSCHFAHLVPVDDLKEHPRNANHHSKQQIDRLAKLIEAHGFRHPIIVSKTSGFVVAGHGRLKAAQKLGLELVPVDFQEFKNEEAEYAFLISDNSIASWSELDLSAINADLVDLGPDFDIDLLGIAEFTIEPAEKMPEPEAPKEAKPQVVQCPNCGEAFDAKTNKPGGSI